MNRSVLAILTLTALLWFSLPATAGDPPEAPAPVADIGDEPKAPEDPAAAPKLDPDKQDESADKADECEGCTHHARDKAGHKPDKPIEGAVGLIAGGVFILLAGVSVLAFLSLILVSFPGTIAAIKDSASGRGGFSLLLGLVNTVFVFLLVAALGAANNPPAGIIAVLILFAFGVVAILGLSGRAQLTGAKAAELAGFRSNPLVSLVLGFAIIYFTGLIPIVGWILFAYWAVAGVGAVLVTVFSRSRQPAPATPDKGIKLGGPDYTV